MPKRFYVVDQNYYRDDRLASKLKNDKDARFVIPDVAFIEMTKSNSWESTIRQSLEFLSQYPNRCYASKSVPEMMQFEIRTRKSADGFMIYREFTRVVRSLLREIKTGQDGSAFERFRSEVESIRTDLAEEQLQHDLNLGTLSGLVEITRGCLGTKVLNLLRKGELSAQEIADLALMSAPNLMSSFYRRVDFPTHRVPSFLKRKPLTFRVILLKYWLSLDWVARGGIETLSDKKATNEFMDQDYVVAASYFDGILSNDAKVNRSFEAIQCMLVS